jgi:type IV conjugative transfer system protein TraE
MDKFNFDAEINTLRSNYKTFKKYLLWMIGANLVLVLALVFNLNREKIILVPQVTPEYKMWITKYQASPEFLNTLSRNKLDLLLNITPNNVNAQHQELIRSVAPQYRAELQSKLAEIAKQITQNNLSQNFYIESIRIVNGGNVVYVEGILNQYIDKNMSSSAHQIYKLTFGVSNYAVQINNIELIPDNDQQLRDLKNA